MLQNIKDRYSNKLAASDGLKQWMDKRGYRSIGEFRGKMKLHSAPNAATSERGDYQRMLQIWTIQRGAFGFLDVVPAR